MFKLNKIQLGIIFGTIVGLIDITPMLIQKLPAWSNFSAFAMWVVVGLMTATTTLPLTGALKGIIIAYLIFLPTGILIAQAEPLSLIPICTMTLMLGILLGYFIEKLTD
ncbi:MAG: hypothetical protein WC901_02810 [Candidatus Margulisiibacteriota bacterium]